MLVAKAHNSVAGRLVNGGDPNQLSIAPIEAKRKGKDGRVDAWLPTVVRRGHSPQSSGCRRRSFLKQSMRTIQGLAARDISNLPVVAPLTSKAPLVPSYRAALRRNGWVAGCSAFGSPPAAYRIYARSNNFLGVRRLYRTSRDKFEPDATHSFRAIPALGDRPLLATIQSDAAAIPARTRPYLHQPQIPPVVSLMSSFSEFGSSSRMPVDNVLFPGIEPLTTPIP